MLQNVNFDFMLTLIFLALRMFLHPNPALPTDLPSLQGINSVKTMLFIVHSRESLIFTFNSVPMVTFSA